MSIEFACPTCKKRYKVDSALAGRRVMCKACQSLMRIPDGTPEAPEPEPLPFDFVPAGKPVVAPPMPAMRPASPPPLPVQQCPSCRGPLPPGGVVCIGCGYDTRVGRRLNTAAPGKSFSLLRVAGALAVMTVLAFVVKFAFYQAGKHHWRLNGTSPLTPAPRQVAQPVFPPRPRPERIDENTLAYSMKIGGTGPGLPMEIRLFVPVGHHGGTLPCVFIAPAGTRLIHGSSLGEGNLPEYLPYVHAGFAVLAYELSGDVPNDSGGPMPYVKLREPMRQFMAADGGIDNARHAVDFVLGNVPEIDPARLFAAGHSSAATMALNVVANDHRFRAAAAYAPRCDVVADFAADRAILDELVTGGSAFLERISPRQHVRDIACPVFLFHADDDSRIPTGDNQAFAAAMSQAGKEVQFKRVAQGGHYQSMIDEGIPAGIAFFQAHGAAAPSGSPAPAATLPPPTVQSPPTPEPSRQWEKVPAQPDALAPELSIGDYAIRPPAGFALVRTKDHWNWMTNGPAGRSVFQIAVRDRKTGNPPGPVAEPSNPGSTDPPDSAHPSGLIGGIRFHRSERPSPSTFKCTYGATDGEKVIIISITAVDPQTLANLEAATRTLRKRAAAH